MYCISDVIIIVIIIIILFILIYLFQYNQEELIKDNIPRDIFNKIDYSEFDKNANIGLENASKSKLIICGLIRNGEKNISNFIKKCLKLCSYFKDYRILIMENDSNDNTREILLNWNKLNPKIIILGCGVNAPKCKMNFRETKDWSISKFRIGKMVKLRNIYLDYIKKYFNDFDYTIVWDMDLVGSVYIDGIFNTLGKMAENKNIDAVCANGVRRYFRNFTYYDCYAHIMEDENIDSNDRFMHALKIKFNTMKDRNKNKLIKVKSCFGGFTIYRTSSLLNSEYSSDLDNTLECEHTGLHSDMENVYYNPLMINYVLENPK